MEGESLLDLKPMVTEGQTGGKDGLHCFDWTNWLVVVPFQPQAHENDVGVALVTPGDAA